MHSTNWTPHGLYNYLKGPCSTLEMGAADFHAIRGIPCIHGPKICVQCSNVVENACHLILDVCHIIHNAGVYVVPGAGGGRLYSFLVNMCSVSQERGQEN